PCPVSFFLDLVRASRPTLFPYTTLFRSIFGHSDHLSDLLERHIEELAHQEYLTLLLRERGDRLVQRLVQLIAHGLPVRGHPAARDRKSTRLHSSHVKISYAASCLKKKNH